MSDRDSDATGRLSQLLDDLGAGRAPRDRYALTPEEATLAETAAFLKAAQVGSGEPEDRFVAELGARLAMQRVWRTGRAAPEPSPEDGLRAYGLSRQRVLGRLASTIAGLVVGAGLDAAAADDHGEREGYNEGASAPYNVPLVPEDRGHWLWTGWRTPDLRPGHALRFRAGAVEGFLLTPGDGHPPYAVSAACTHMGCLLAWVDGPGTFLCPCHGAQYQADGTALSCVARQPLPRLQTRVALDGHIWVWGVPQQPATVTLAPYAHV